MANRGNYIDEVKIRKGILGKWDLFKYKLSLIYKLCKSKQFYAVDLSKHPNGTAHMDILMHRLHPNQVMEISAEIYAKLYNSNQMANEAKNILNNLN